MKNVLVVGLTAMLLSACGQQAVQPKQEVKTASITVDMDKISSEFVKRDELDKALETLEVTKDTDLTELTEKAHAIENEALKKAFLTKLASVQESINEKKIAFEDEEKAKAIAESIEQSADLEEALAQANTIQDEAKRQEVVAKIEEKKQVAAAQPSTPASPSVPSTSPSTPSTPSQPTTKPTQPSTPSQPSKPSQPSTPAPAQKYRVGALGNSGMEFATFEEADKWALEYRKTHRSALREKYGNAAYFVHPVLWSDDTFTYTVTFG